MPANCSEFTLFSSSAIVSAGLNKSVLAHQGYFRHRTVDASKYVVFNPLLGVDVSRGDDASPHGITNHSIVPPSSPSPLWSYPATEGQDRLVLKLLQGKRNGFYVDLAARYWHKGSNTFALDYYHGWAGICIEPDSHFYPGLVLNRTCLVSCNNPVSNKAETRHFHYELEGTLDKAGNDKGKKTTVQLGRVLRRLRAPRVIDYLSLGA